MILLPGCEQGDALGSPDLLSITCHAGCLLCASKKCFRMQGLCTAEAWIVVWVNKGWPPAGVTSNEPSAHSGGLWMFRLLRALLVCKHEQGNRGGSVS